MGMRKQSLDLLADTGLHKPVLDHLNTAVILLDTELVVRYMNPAAEMLLALSASRANGQPMPACLRHSGDAEAALRRSISDSHPFTCREARLLITPGHEVVVDYTVTPLILPGQGMTLLLEMQQLDRMLRISREDGLIRAHQVTQALVRGLAHEIKNPLGGIRGAAQLLEKELPGSDVTEYTRVIIQEADRLCELADRMLGARQLPSFTPVNIHECLERVLQLVGAEQIGLIKLERDYDPSLPELSGDRDQLIQVMLNLVRNATQSLTESVVTAPCITVRTRVLRQFTIGVRRYRLVARVDIEDNGPGISEELLGTLFYPMVSGRASGTGLGLPIAQSIIGQHHGLLECDSQPGHTVFTVLLPIESCKEDPARVHVSTPDCEDRSS